MTASAHIITAVIGSGVLSLAWAIAQLGWVAGPAVLMAFSFITYFTSTLLADCYRSPDPVHGKRNYTYMDVVRANLGNIILSYNYYWFIILEIVEGFFFWEGWCDINGHVIWGFCLVLCRRQKSAALWIGSVWKSHWCYYRLHNYCLHQYGVSSGSNLQHNDFPFLTYCIFMIGKFYFYIKNFRIKTRFPVFVYYIFSLNDVSITSFYIKLRLNTRICLVIYSSNDMLLYISGSYLLIINTYVSNIFIH